MKPTMMKIRDLRLADTVQLFPPGQPWGTGIVQQIKDGVVSIFRPYGVTADFSYTGGVICYMGFETTQYFVDSSHELLVLERKELK